MVPSTNASSRTLPLISPQPRQVSRFAHGRIRQTAEVQGVSYLTGSRQDVSAFAAKDFWYTFQGLAATASGTSRSSPR